MEGLDSTGNEFEGTLTRIRFVAGCCSAPVRDGPLVYVFPAFFV